MTTLAVTTVDLARAQFATTSLYHFLFVPLTLGLAPLVAIMQTPWYRTGVDAWLRLTQFFGTLLLINFAIGVATGLVQEFQFGMNWSVYSAYVGDVFGAPLAIEGLAAFFLEATFLGPLDLRLGPAVAARAPRDDLARRRSARGCRRYFILVANSWMQHPVGYEVVDGEAQLHERLGAAHAAAFAALRVHCTRCSSALTTGALVVLGVSCWHLARGRNVDVFRRAAALALIVARARVTLGEPDRRQPASAIVEHRLPADEDRGGRGAVGHRAARGLLALPDRRLLDDDQTPSFDIEVPHLLSILATGTLERQGRGTQPAPAAGAGPVRARQLHAARRAGVLGRCA